MFTVFYFTIQAGFWLICGSRQATRTLVFVSQEGSASPAIYTARGDHDFVKCYGSIHNSLYEFINQFINFGKMQFQMSGKIDDQRF
jgi:hypothetical protein